MIAIAGPNLPHQLLQAAGRHGGALPLNPDRDCPRAGQWLESKFQPWTPRVLEHWLDGDYDHFDAVMFSRADDSSQRLYYYLCEMQRAGQVGGPEPLIFDVAKVPRQSSVTYMTEKLHELASQLSVDAVSLETAIRQGNAAAASAGPEASGPACLVVGSPPPDGRLFDAVAKAGFVAVGKTLAQSWMARAAPVAEGTSDPFAALAQALHEQDSGPRTFADPAKRLRRQVADSTARAVVVWHIEEDETRTWQLPAERAVLEQSGLPFLVLSRRDWLAGDGAAGEIAAFLAGVSA